MRWREMCRSLRHVQHIFNLIYTFILKYMFRLQNVDVIDCWQWKKSSSKGMVQGKEYRVVEWSDCGVVWGVMVAGESSHDTRDI